MAEIDQKIMVADTDLPGDLSEISARSGAVLDQLGGNCGDPLTPLDRDNTGRQFRTTTKARTKAGDLGGSGIAMKAAIPPLWQSDPTNRPAVNSGRTHPDKEVTIKTQVTLCHDLVTVVRGEAIKHHRPSLNKGLVDSQNSNPIVQSVQRLPRFVRFRGATPTLAHHISTL